MSAKRLGLQSGKIETKLLSACILIFFILSCSTPTLPPEVNLWSYNEIVTLQRNYVDVEWSDWRSGYKHFLNPFLDWLTIHRLGLHVSIGSIYICAVGVADDLLYTSYVFVPFLVALCMR